ncbi:uncharacterized protein PITG_20510 [Phytophthora infestans T30-4]|uniref:Transmembrane protein n=1 Tax=Phytophthora infestans (strain T30-4) TaxID=403677 RepID=D0P1Z9_PHYIT|nr:uncharacterized protein PITG_20510 [Phytophthora infestans T30-4]EEY55143.1 conserved hypothetical protein [Phytophthora infestans T30-4]|eukprot:XP_002895681.1 conserved hypothetical protein [Phytophthora infestans T30-4]
MDDGKNRHMLLANDDVFAEGQQDRQDELDALVDSLAQPSGLGDLQSFLVNSQRSRGGDGHISDEQEQKQKELDALVDSLSGISMAPSPATATATALLASDVNDVGVANTQASFLNVIEGAVLLLVAVVLIAMTRRSQSKREEEADERMDFGYIILYE